ncbi:hypothetical protein AG0111_0g12624 [Alternaria gaisen]|uniref:Uncharacterized protein n=1 Tax=Alternaria gaisen TaxID=167740 RepID=A0ACB6F3Z5_9PLEO|nr:hypothetical protein AG0111_0g12624 [Alternaria gaisen]
MLSLLLHLSTEVGISTFYKAFEAACRLSKVSLLYLFFRPSPIIPARLAINKVYSFSDKGYRIVYPLDTAIRLAKRNHVGSIIKKLLKLGADPNGPKYRASLRRSLHLATIVDRVSGILPLLDTGANPHLINDAGGTKKQRKKYGKTSMRGQALRIALKRYTKSKPAKGVEGFLAEVDEQIKEDMVAVKHE